VVPAAARDREDRGTQHRAAGEGGTSLHWLESAICARALDYGVIMATLSHSDLRELLEPMVTGAGYDLEEVAVTRAGRRSVVRVVVDRDGGVDLDAVAEVSRGISTVMDAADPLGEQPYVLEVTSPGVDRPLTLPRHWRRNVGRLVTAGAVQGRVREVTEDGVILDIKGDREEISFDDLPEGRVVVEFKHLDVAE
jgi:ribosome maturation factor RimP